MEQDRDGLSAYEHQRNANIARNRAFMERIGLVRPVSRAACAASPIDMGLVSPPCEEVDVCDAVEALRRRWPGRDEEVDALCGALIGAGDAPILVGGPPATGKTSIVRAVIEAVVGVAFAAHFAGVARARGVDEAAQLRDGLPFGRVRPSASPARRRVAAAVHVAASTPTPFGSRAPQALGMPCAWVDCGSVASRCSQGASAAKLFEAAGASLFEGQPAAPSGSCRDAVALARRADAARRTGACGAVCVVLDRCERLFGPYRCGAPRGDDAAAQAVGQLLAAARLATRVDCRVVFVGDDRRLAPHGTCLRDPLRVHLAPYDAARLVDVLVATGARRGLCPGGGPRAPTATTAAYRAFCGAIASVARRASGDVGDLAVLTSSRPLFDLYREAHDEAGAAAAYKRVLPVLQAAVPRLRDPELDVDDLARRRFPRSCVDGDTPCDAGGPAPAPAASDAARLLPRADVLLLLSSYISSRSPRERDQCLFTNTRAARAHLNADRGGKRRKKNDATKVPLDGPQAVPLDRILSIHAYLASEHLGAAPDIRDPMLLLQLSTLAKLRLVERAHPHDDLANPKFTCLLDADAAYDLADAIRLPLGRYVH